MTLFLILCYNIYIFHVNVIKALLFYLFFFSNVLEVSYSGKQERITECSLPHKVPEVVKFAVQDCTQILYYICKFIM